MRSYSDRHIDRQTYRQTCTLTAHHLDASPVLPALNELVPGEDRHSDLHTPRGDREAQLGQLAHGHDQAKLLPHRRVAGIIDCLSITSMQ